MHNEQLFFLGNEPLTLNDFYHVLYEGKKVAIAEAAIEKMVCARKFIDYLLDNKIKVYGLTTGYADLRNCSVSAADSSQLSVNLIHSHDAGIGPPLSDDVVLGAMLIRANSLAKGNSGFKPESLQTLVQMINAKVIPEIPSYGSLGASGDLAYFARLGMAMQGEEVPVSYQNRKTTAKKALLDAGIEPFRPGAKEGLALTNGTSFMASMLALAYLKELHFLENFFALQGLFLNAVGAVPDAFTASIQTVRKQKGQEFAASIFRQLLADSPFCDLSEVQNDYCIRCLPQIIGPKLEIFFQQYDLINRELDAVTDNPIIFKDEEISKDIEKEKIFYFNSSYWAVLSGGNFHGEYLASAADCMTAANAKIALTMERQLTYLLNPSRNKQKLPVYLIANAEKSGLLSGFMITQYTANALTQKICQLGIPSSIFNITSANESEDIVSYGATAGQRLLEQLDLLHQLSVIYLTTASQAYAIARKGFFTDENHSFISEKIFNSVQKSIPPLSFPFSEDQSFMNLYQKINSLVSSPELRILIDFPLCNYLNLTGSLSKLSEIYG